MRPRPFDDRHPKQPWLYDVRDVREQGEPETTVFLPNREQLEGLHIRGFEDDVMLGVRTNEFGDPLSCAITMEIALDMAPSQSNPRRLDDEDAA